MRSNALKLESTKRLVFVLLTLFIGSSFAEDPADNARSKHWQLPIPLQGSPAATLPDNVRNLEAQNCAICHPVQFKAWASSIHSRAVGDGLLGQLYAFDSDTQQDCLKCHAPRSEQISALLSASPLEKQSGGVDCASCHVRKHIRYGPRDIPKTPHGAVSGTQLFKQAEFCQPCHQFDESGAVANGKPLENTYAEWQASPQAAQGSSCQDCHMPDQVHSFRGIHDPEMTRKGLGIQTSRTASGVSVKLINTGAAHALPTYITPKIVVRIVSASGKTSSHTLQRKMHWDVQSGWSELSDTRLLPNQSSKLSLDLRNGETAMITVTVYPDADYYDRIYPVLLDALADDLQPEYLAQLNAAYQSAGKTAYVLYSFICDDWAGAALACLADLE